MIAALIGLISSIVMIIIGLIAIAIRGEMETHDESFGGAEVRVGKFVDEIHSVRRPSYGVRFFRGSRKRRSLYAEKSTAEILTMVLGGRWREAWPWALLALGLLLIFFWGPLVFGLLAGWEGPWLWAFVGFFFLGALWAARPRRQE